MSLPHPFIRSASESRVHELLPSSSSSHSLYDAFAECTMPKETYVKADAGALASVSNEKTRAISILFTNIIEDLVGKIFYPPLQKLVDLVQGLNKLPPACVIPKESKLSLLEDDSDSSDEFDEDSKRLPANKLQKVVYVPNNSIMRAAWEGVKKVLSPLHFKQEVCPGPLLTRDLTVRAANFFKIYAGTSSLEKLDKFSVPSFIVLPGEGSLSDRLTRAVAIQAFRVAVDQHQFKAEETWQLITRFRLEVEALSDGPPKKQLTEFFADLSKEKLASGKGGLPLHKSVFGSSW